MDKDLIPEGYLKDEKTGYLVHTIHSGGNAFGVESKQRFLKLMEEEGGLAKVCDLLGISTRTVYDHMQIDEAFMRDYTVCIRRMASNLESTMYKNGQRPQGYMDRVTWLRRWLPNEWTPKTSITLSQDTTSLDQLFKTLEDQGKLINVNLDKDQV